MGVMFAELPYSTLAEKRFLFSSFRLGSLADYLAQPANFCVPSKVAILKMVMSHQSDFMDSESVCSVYSSVSSLINGHLEGASTVTEDQYRGALVAVEENLLNGSVYEDDSNWMAWAKLVVACVKLAWKEQDDGRSVLSCRFLLLFSDEYANLAC